MKSKIFAALLSALSLLEFTGCGSTDGSAVTTASEIVTESQTETESETEESFTEATKKTGDGKTHITLIDHACVMIKSAAGTVIYVDPNSSAKCEEEADAIFITHPHSDHNAVSVVPHKDTTQEITNFDMLSKGEYKTVEIDDVKVTAVASYNNGHLNGHPKEYNVGYVIEVDGIKIYHAGDAGKIVEMDDIGKTDIDYAFYPTDGTYTMSIEEALECADIVGAKYNVAMHTTNQGDYNQEAYYAFAEKYGETIKSGESIEIPAE